MYVMKITTAGRYRYIKCYTPLCSKASGKRNQRMNESPEAVKKYNNERRSEKLQLLIIANFDKGYHLTLDYPKGQKPETYEEAEDNLKKTLYAVSRRLKKIGKKFKYIAVTERGKKAAALHHHLIIEHDPDVMDELLAVWGQRIHASVMYQDGQYKELADYIVKMETKEEQTKGKSKYHRSRNLDKPVERRHFIRGPLLDEPYVPKGFQLIRESFRAGENEVLHIKWQKYMVEKMPSKPLKPVKTKEAPKECTKRESIFDVAKRVAKKLFRRD